MSKRAGDLAMSSTRDKVTSELEDGAKAVPDTVHDPAAKQDSCVKSRVRSSSKTPKSVMTRDRIMTAASELMVERGDTSFQMSEVSERCHMSKGSLYYYFADKDELIGAIFDESVDDLVELIESLARETGSARDALCLFYSEFSRRLADGSPLALAMTYKLASTAGGSIPEVTSHFSRAAGAIASQLERAKSEGLIRQDMDSDTAAIFATGGLITMSMAVASGQAAADAETVSSRIKDLILRGVGV